jgi:hypothetical protein
MSFPNRHLTFTLVFALAWLASSPARTDAENDFMAMPGLWKTTFRNQQVANSKAQIWWHCVDENADPWISFAQLQPPEHEACVRMSFTRTATFLMAT